jgi:hypothetical protein
VILWLWACENRPPSLLALNGRPPMDESVRQGIVALQAPMAPGETVELEVFAEDPEGDVFEVWFPGVAGVVDFLPEARRGQWTAPIDRIPVSLELLLRDPDDPLASHLYLIVLEE